MNNPLLSSNSYITDFNCNALPYMHGGADLPSTACKMLKHLESERVNRVLLASRFDASAQTVPAYISQRTDSFDLIKSQIPKSIKTYNIAKVFFTPDTLMYKQISRLSLFSSNYILIELPLMPFADWINSSLKHLSTELGLLPVFADFDKYRHIFSSTDYLRLTNIEHAAFQFSFSSLLSRDIPPLIELIRSKGGTVILGSSSSDFELHPPMISTALSRLKQYMGATEFNMFILKSNSFLKLIKP